MKRIPLVLCTFLAACGHRDAAPSADAGVASATDNALRVIAQHEPLRAEVARATPFTLGEKTFVAHGPGLAVALPKTAAGVAHLERPGEAGTYIEIQASDARDVPGVTNNGAVVYANAAAGADVVFLAGPNRVEELRVLHAPAVHRARYHLHVGPRIAGVRAREDRIECVDAAGSVRIGTDALYAVDAVGARIPVTPHVAQLGVSDWSVELEVDASRNVAPIVIDPAWTTVASMRVGRYQHAGVTLADGKVLIAGGSGGPSSLSSAELYDPVANTWSDVGSMAVARQQFQLVRLNSGRVLAVSTTAEFYDPTTKTWSTDSTMPSPPSVFNVTVRLPSGKIVVLVEANGPGGDTTLIYDETASTKWSIGAPTPRPRSAFGATALADGRVLVVGGNGTTVGKVVSDAEIYDPVSNTWTITAPRPVRARVVTVVPAGGSKAIAIGGNLASSGWVTDVDLFDGATGTWTKLPPMPEPYSWPSAAWLDADRLLVEAGGPALVLHLPTSKWFPASMGTSWPNASLVPMSGGRVFKAGGAGLVDATIFASMALGGTCNASKPGDCTSLTCADSVCCNRACDGACEQCDITGSAGTCTALTGAPHPSRTCAPYAACAAGSCKTMCTADTDCVSTSWCSSGSCVPRVAAGATCTLGRQCLSGNCVDGVCCDSACAGQCEACDIPGSEGTCSAVTGTPRGARSACGDPTNPCEKVCNGTTRATCVYLAAGTSPCGTNSCSAGTETHASTCNGAGACGDVPRSCGAYACGSLACKTACGTASDCAAGHICASGACIVAPGLGAPCTDGSACSTGFCVDSVCCGVASCGTGSTCAATGKAGRCTKLAGVACATSDECATGNCVDGVCCDGACAGQCEACNLPGKVGKCAPVRGAPRGSRMACASDPANTCATKVCDGTARTECAAFAGKDVSCREASCADGEATVAASCDGAGACPLEKKSCGGFACDGTSCRLICSTDEHCAKDYFCSAGACRPKVPTCSTDFTESVAVDGSKKSCAPFRCRAGECPTTCGSSSDCLAGTVCSDGQCVAPAAADDGGGCSSSPRSPRAPLAMLLAISLLVALRARRTRASALSLAILALGCRHEATTSPAARAVVATIERVPELAHRLGHGTHAADAILPGTARAPMNLGSGDRRLAVEALDVVDAAAEVIDGSRIHRDVAASTDLVFAHVGSGVEELRVLRDPSAPTTFRWRLRLAADLGKALANDARVTVFDRAGRARFRTDPFVAFDAAGKRRDLTVSAVPDGDGAIVTASLDTASLTFPIVVDPLWSILPESSYANSRMWTALLNGGDLLAGNYFAEAERFRFSTNTWLDVKANTVFAPQAANAGSKVFLLGLDSLTPSAAHYSQLFDPTTNTWTVTGNPAVVRGRPFVATLASGKVMVGGGTLGHNGSTVLATTEIFDAATGVFTPGPALMRARLGGVAVQLNGGKLLLAAGEDGAADISAAEIYDPTSNTWSAAGSMTGGYGSLSPAASGTKALFEGTGGTFLFDLATLSWESVARPSVVTGGSHSLAPLPSGRVLLVGDLAGSPAAHVFDPVRKVWLTAGRLTYGRQMPSARALADGRVAVVGGESPTMGFIFDVEIFQEQPNGTACVGGGECTSGNCVDGYCCNTACSGSCDACNLSGKLGTCSPVTGAPTPKHPACAPYKACVAGSCDNACTSDAECCTTVDECCKDSTCSTSFAGAFCNGSACVAKKAAGQTCTRTAECLSGNCVDGVCCDTACNGQCEACAEPGKVGTCSPISGTPKGGRAACTGITVGGECGTRCDGVNGKICTYPPAGVSRCSVNGCSGGVETHLSSCDGVGRCNDVTKTCGAYACGSTACRTSCGVNSDCAVGFYCNAGACLPSPSLGQPCSSTKPCLGSLFCTDGYCCGVDGCGAGRSCGLPASRGTCAKVNGTACGGDGECGSGSCVDTVCCDTPCSGQCQACNEPGSAGACVAIKGAPRGSRTACATVAGAPCESTVCDGVDGARCAGYVAAESSCRDAKCADGIVTAPATCDGAGACPAAVTTSCAPYKCDSAGKSCATSCGSSADCTGGFVCTSGACTKAERRCSDDNLSILDPEGKPTSCAPFLCRGAECLAKCETSTDCVTGTACDPSGRCLPASVDPGAAEDSGGCAIDHRDGRRGSFAALSLLALSILVARRRRAMAALAR